jgi:alkylation response protein AidB-like acyl-CoA dehydrogenase
MSIALTLSDDQQLLTETTRRFIETELPLSATRALHDLPSGFTRSWWQQGAELGWFAMLVSEEHGGGDGDGEGLLGASLIAELHGANVQPGPFVPTNVVAWSIATAGTEALQADVLPAVLDGSTVATWASATSIGAAGATVVASRQGDGLRLAGPCGIVQDATAADLCLVTAQLDGEAVVVLVDLTATGVELVALDGLDLSRRFAQVTLTDVDVPAERVLSGGEPADGLEQRALVLNAAETVGAMDALFAMTVEYAKDRIAFGRPIGSFQAIKHILADQALYLETAKAGVAAAVRDVARADAQVTEQCHIVAAYVGEHGNELAQECLQVFGGIGFTWEHDLHLLMRRIRVNSALYGDPTTHRDAIATFHEATR